MPVLVNPYAYTSGGGGGGGGGPTYVGPVDSFTAGTYNGVWSASAGCSVVAGRSRHLMDQAFDGELTTGFSYAFDEGLSLVEVVVDATGDNRDVYFYVGINAPNRAMIELVGSTLYFVAGGTDTNIAYDATAHRWWRMTETGADLIYDTSPDGATWTTQRTVTGHGMDLSIVRVLLGAGRNTAVGGPFYAYFDNMNNPPT